MTYNEWLNSLDLKYFAASEINPGEEDRLPPFDQWKNIVKTLTWAEHLRERCGRLRINSAYRSHELNTRVGGKKQSLHLRNMALDLTPLDTTATVLNKWALASRGDWVAHPALEKIGLKRWQIMGGIGAYSSFIHIDCRAFNATWSL